MLAARRSSISIEEGAPVSDAILSRLYRADINEIAGIVLPLPEGVRARLAAFCYGRAHLRKIGGEIAAHCDEVQLTHHVGAVVARSMIEAIRLPRTESFGMTPAYSRPKVSVATAGDMRRREPTTDDHVRDVID